MTDSMKFTRPVTLQRLAVVLLVFAITGCDSASTPSARRDASVATGAVQRIGDQALTVNAVSYGVTSATKFGGRVSSLADLSVGDGVRMKVKEKNGAMQALEVEDHDEADDGNDEDGNDDDGNDEGEHDGNDDGEHETAGKVSEVGAGTLVVDGTRFVVTDSTEFEEGYASLSDVQVGDVAEVEYETRSDNSKAALSVEKDDGSEGHDDGHDDGNDDGEHETAGKVSEVGAGALVVDSTRFVVTDSTEFEEGYASLSDVQVGDVAEVEYETRSDNSKAALSVEKDDGSEGHDDGNDDDGNDDGEHDGDGGGHDDE